MNANVRPGPHLSRVASDVEWRAFDRLPKAARKALAEAAVKFNASGPLEKAARKIPRAAELVYLIERADRLALADAHNGTAAVYGPGHPQARP